MPLVLASLSLSLARSLSLPFSLSLPSTTHTSSALLLEPVLRGIKPATWLPFRIRYRI